MPMGGFLGSASSHCFLVDDPARARIVCFELPVAWHSRHPRRLAQARCYRHTSPSSQTLKCLSRPLSCQKSVAVVAQVVGRSVIGRWQIAHHSYLRCSWDDCTGTDCTETGCTETGQSWNALFAAGRRKRPQAQHVEQCWIPGQPICRGLRGPQTRAEAQGLASWEEVPSSMGELVGETQLSTLAGAAQESCFHASNWREGHVQGFGKGCVEGCLWARGMQVGSGGVWHQLLVSWSWTWEE